LTIWHNRIDTCLFIGGHCHQSDLEDRAWRHELLHHGDVRSAGHEDAMFAFRDITPDHIIRLADKVRELKGTVPGPAAVQ
jgi:hypothetical protein